MPSESPEFKGWTDPSKIRDAFRNIKTNQSKMMQCKEDHLSDDDSCVLSANSYTVEDACGSPQDPFENESRNMRINKFWQYESYQCYDTVSRGYTVNLSVL